MKKISIVIPNWNGVNLLKRNLEKVVQASEGSEIIVVDDNSTDKSIDYIRTTYPGVKLLINDKNYGFAKSCNKAVASALGDIIVLLNTDVSPEKEFLKPIQKDFTDNKIFAVSLGEASSGPGWATFDNGDVSLVRKDHTKDKSLAFWASGGQAAFSKEKWNKLGGFDEIYYPFYWEDIDLSYRAWKSGYKIIWDPSSVVHHNPESTISAHFSKEYINFIAERNKLIFIWKNITDKDYLNKHKKYLLKRLRKPSFWKPFISALLKYPSIKHYTEAISDKEIFKKFS